MEADSTPFLVAFGMCIALFLVGLSADLEAARTDGKGPEVPRPAVTQEADDEPIRDDEKPVHVSAAEEAGVDPALFRGLLLAENGGRMTADVSRAGAIGPAQLMPGTARELGVDPRNPHANVRGGARYLKRMKDRYDNDTLALIAYNMGPGATDRWLARGGDWSKLPKETREYVSKVKVKAAVAGRRA